MRVGFVIRLTHAIIHNESDWSRIIAFLQAFLCARNYVCGLGILMDNGFGFVPMVLDLVFIDR